MRFNRLLKISGSVFFSALSFALVEKLYFKAQIEAQPSPSRALSSLPPASLPPLTVAPPLMPNEPARAPAAFPAMRTPDSAIDNEEIKALPESIDPMPAAGLAVEPRKSIWLWLSSGAAKHTLLHNLSSGTNSSFRSLQAPSLGIRAGFEVGKLGLDASYDSAPGKVSSAPNATVEGGSYHWNALRADATWRGMGESWKLRLGAQQHTSPFLYPDSSSGKIYLRRVRLNFVALGLEWTPRISEQGRLEARATYLHAINADSLDRAQIDLSRKVSGNFSLGWVHSAGDHLRLGAYFQSEIQNYSFSYRASPGTPQHNGTQKLSSHSLGLKFGWEY